MCKELDNIKVYQSQDMHNVNAWGKIKNNNRQPNPFSH